MALLLTITSYIRKLESIFSYLGVLLILGMMFLGAADVISRNVFYQSITGSIEWSQLMQAGIVILGWSYVQSTDSHIKVDLFHRKFPPALKKTTDVFILILTAFIFSLIMWRSFQIGMLDFEQGRLVPTILVPQWPFKMLVPIGSFFLVVECLIQLIERISGKKLEPANEAG